MSADDLKSIVHSDPEIMGGTPVFVGTRVPLQNLIDSLEGGESIEDFLDGFPSVKREQVIAVIEAGKLRMLETPLRPMIEVPAAAATAKRLIRKNASLFKRLA
ncbi:MAG TPA: DUF433 domain-containing protein [Chthoniobacterales bacterium]|jgi:uncharacterized protein (DUF433 family)|nr:DUF433 domain-containing protein [Chthoniobacterales bacterium]